MEANAKMFLVDNLKHKYAFKYILSVTNFSNTLMKKYSFNTYNFSPKYNPQQHC